MGHVKQRGKRGAGIRGAGIRRAGIRAEGADPGEESDSVGKGERRPGPESDNDAGSKGSYVVVMVIQVRSTIGRWLFEMGDRLACMGMRPKMGLLLRSAPTTRQQASEGQQHHRSTVDSWLRTHLESNLGALRNVGNKWTLLGYFVSEKHKPMESYGGVEWERPFGIWHLQKSSIPYARLQLTPFGSPGACTCIQQPSVGGSHSLLVVDSSSSWRTTQ